MGLTVERWDYIVLTINICVWSLGILVAVKL